MYISVERHQADPWFNSIHNLVEGSWDRVLQVIGQAHTILHQQGIVRIQTDIRVGSRYSSFFLLFRLPHLSILL